VQVWQELTYQRVAALTAASASIQASTACNLNEPSYGTPPTQPSTTQHQHQRDELQHNNDKQQQQPHRPYRPSLSGMFQRYRRQLQEQLIRCKRCKVYFKYATDSCVLVYVQLTAAYWCMCNWQLHTGVCATDSCMLCWMQSSFPGCS